MGWDVGLHRRLAVPLALSDLEKCIENKLRKPRKLRKSDDDPQDYKILQTLADNRVRIDSLLKDMEEDPIPFECSDVLSELDFIKANIQLGLLGVSSDLDETMSSDEIFEEAIA
jgi:hypothetical protein